MLLSRRLLVVFGSLAISLHLAGASSTAMMRNPTFPFSINNEEEYDEATGNLLKVAARSGDISHLDDLQKRFQGVVFERHLAEAALECGHLEFFKRFTMLSRMTLIAVKSYERSWFWCYYLDPLQCALQARASDEIRFQAVKFYFEEVLPNLPSEDEVVRGRVVYMDDYLIRLPSHRHTIWSLPDVKAFNNPHDLKICRIAALRYPYMPILEYLSIRIELKYSLYSLHRLARSFSGSFYNFALKHLDPTLDKSKIPQNCQFGHPPSDADFVYLLFEASNQFKFRPSESIVLDFLQEYPEFRYKVPSIMEWLRDFQSAEDNAKFPESKQFLHHYHLRLTDSRCADLLKFLERIASSLGPIDDPRDIEFGSKLLVDRIPKFSIALSDQEIIANASSEQSQLGEGQSAPIPEQRSSFHERCDNDASSGDDICSDDDDAYTDDDDGEDDFYDGLDPYTREQMAYSEEDDTLYPEPDNE